MLPTDTANSFQVQSATLNLQFPSRQRWCHRAWHCQWSKVM